MERFAATARQLIAQLKPKEPNMTDTDPFTPATCPLPHCHHDLHLVTSQSRPVHLDDLERGDPDASDPYASTWRVECEDGHVVLLPDLQGMCCICGDDGCNGDQGDGHADFDGSDDYRTFRVADVRRLRNLVDQFAATVAA